MAMSSSLSLMSTSSTLEVPRFDVGMVEGASTLCFFFLDNEGLSHEGPNLFFKAEWRDSKVGLIIIKSSIKLVKIK